jgi:hypothetical protein
MQKLRSLASSCCSASGRNSSDWDVWASKAELHLRSGTQCFGPEVCMAKLGMPARAGYLHQSLGENARVVVPHLERLASQIDVLEAICLRLFGPSVMDEPHWQFAAQESAGP